MMRKLCLFLASLMIMLLIETPTIAATGALSIDMDTAYAGMSKSYSQGYVPTINSDTAYFVLPLKCSDNDVMSVTVAPAIGTDRDTPFSYVNYEFNVTRSTAAESFVIRLSLPLKSNRVNGTYPVTFKVNYTDGASNAVTQEFPVYLTIADGADPNAPAPRDPVIVPDQLIVDSTHLYEGMAKTYEQGYVPLVRDSQARIILPLLGSTYRNKVTVTADLGPTAGNPFVYGNYVQNATPSNNGLYLFSMNIPLSANRINGTYPVVLTASYINTAGIQVSQHFTVYVSISDGRNPGSLDPEGNEPVNGLSIDGKTLYDKMNMTYSQGYIPLVRDGHVHIVLPLVGSTFSNKVTVSADLGSTTGSPFVYGNYVQNATASKNGLYLVSMDIPLVADRINGIYPVVLTANYLKTAGTQASQSFTVYVTINDGKKPSSSNSSIGLQIDSTTLYDKMNVTYAQGYVPMVSNGKATIVLPLKGTTYSGDVNLSADLGSTTDSPFIFGNYSKSVHGNGAYVFVLEIPLSKSRINGVYPVALTAEYVDINGSKASQSFRVFVTITDGKAPADPNATPPKETIKKPELFISSCTINPGSVGGGEEFAVEVTVQNIGNMGADGVRLTFGSEAAGILPAETNNTLLIGALSDGGSKTVTFKMKTAFDILAGHQPFIITLDYNDRYGGVYNLSHPYLVEVSQPARIAYDPLTVPETIVSGESFSLPVNIFNTGRSTLWDVAATITGAGLFQVSSIYLGDIPPGETGHDTFKVYAGMLSTTQGYTDDYGKTSGQCKITYKDDEGTEHSIAIDFKTEVLKPAVNDTDQEKMSEQPEFQWWITLLVGFAIIAVIVSGTVVTKLTRSMKMKAM